MGSKRNTHHRGERIVSLLFLFSSFFSVCTQLFLVPFVECNFCMLTRKGQVCSESHQEDQVGGFGMWRAGRTSRELLLSEVLSWGRLVAPGLSIFILL